MDLPVRGYPISAEAVTNWFIATYGRQPSEREVVSIVNAMAAREASLPKEGPVAGPDGWTWPLAGKPDAADDPV